VLCNRRIGRVFSSRIAVSKKRNAVKKILIGIIAIVVIAGLILGYVFMSKERSEEAESDKPVATESKVSRDQNGDIAIKLDEPSQKILALKIEPLAAAQLEPETKGYGRVLDPATLSAAVADLISARATADASKKELSRIKTLAGENNASARALESAQAAVDRDSAQAESARARFAVTWGKALADREDLPKFVDSLARDESVLVRIDLPAGEFLKSPPLGARLIALGNENTPVDAELIGAAPAVDPQTQGQGFLFLVRSHEPALVPGAAVVGYIKTAGEAQSGVTIPRNAVVRFNGKTWIYVQTENDTFTRREIFEQEPLADGWFMKEGFKPGERVVVTGAQMLLSEEQKYQIQMGD
jgi:hypothetical protein